MDLDISDNPVNCDCKDYEIISTSRFFAKSRWLDGVQCEEPPDLYNLRVCQWLFDMFIDKLIVCFELYSAGSH